jgi:hypothetical protein
LHDSKEAVDMNRRLTVTILVAVALVLACGTLVLAAGLWAGFSWVRGHSQAGYSEPGMMWNEDMPCPGGYREQGMMGKDDMPCAGGYGEPGTMWNDNIPCAGEGYGGPGMMWKDDLPCARGDGEQGKMWTDDIPCAE